MTKSNRFTTCILFCLLFAAGCENYSPTKRDIGALGGAALGAGLGAIVGSEVGDAGPGIAIGAAAGALVGGVVGHTQDEQDYRASEHSEILQRQQQEIERQEREIQDLRRQQYQDGRLQDYRGSSRERSDSYGSRPSSGSSYERPTGDDSAPTYDSWATTPADAGAVHREGLDDSFSRQPAKGRY